MDFLIGYFFGSAVRHKNPLQLVLGFMGASLLLWVLIGLIAVLLTTAPYAAALVDATGISKLLPFLDNSLREVQSDVSVLDALSLQFIASCLMVCAFAVMAIGLVMVALKHLLRLFAVGVAKLLKR